MLSHGHLFGAPVFLFAENIEKKSMNKRGPRNEHLPPSIWTLLLISLFELRYFIRSAHPAKRGQVGMNNNKNRRITARPSVVNIGANNQKRVTKKPKKSTGNAS